MGGEGRGGGGTKGRGAGIKRRGAAGREAKRKSDNKGECRESV